jgi:hypothetical protein
MTWVKWCLDNLLQAWEELKGTKVVKEIIPRDMLQGHLTGYAVAGYEIRLYCQKKTYRREYHWWCIPNREYATYRVFSIVSPDAPTALRKACELEIDLPQMIPSLVSQSYQKQVAIQAYLDILMERIRFEKEEKFRPTM